MATISCKRCDEEVEVSDGMAVVQCPVCGLLLSRQNDSGTEKVRKLMERIHLLLMDERWDKALECSNLLLDESADNSYGYIYNYMATYHLRDFQRLGYDAKGALEKSPQIRHALEFAEPDLKAKLKMQIRFQKEFQQFVDLRGKGRNFEDFEILKLRRELEELWNKGDFQGAMERVHECLVAATESKDAQLAKIRQRLEELVDEPSVEKDVEFDRYTSELKELVVANYAPAKDFMENEWPGLQDMRLDNQFDKMGIVVPPPDEPWEDFCKALDDVYHKLNYLRKRGSKKAKEYWLGEYPKACYQRACQEQRRGNYDRAISLFTSCGGYHDSLERIAECGKARRFNDVVARVLLWGLGIVAAIVLGWWGLKVATNGWKNMNARREIERLITEGKYDSAIMRLNGQSLKTETRYLLEKSLAGKLERDFDEAMKRNQFDEAEKAIKIFEQVPGVGFRDAEDLRQRVEQGRRELLKQQLQFVMQIAETKDVTKYAKAIVTLNQVLEKDPSEKEMVASLEKAFNGFEALPGIYVVRESGQLVWKSVRKVEVSDIQLMTQSARKRRSIPDNYVFRFGAGEALPNGIIVYEMLVTPDW